MGKIFEFEYKKHAYLKIVYNRDARKYDSD